MLDHRFSWQPPEPTLDPVALALELKGFDASKHPRAKNGRFGAGSGTTTIGEAFLAAEKVGGKHKITVHNSRVKKYAGHADVESFVAGHKRGRAAALRELAADHKAGKISLHEPETGATPAAAKPKAPLTASAHPSATTGTPMQDRANAAGISDADIDARAKAKWMRGDAAWNDGANHRQRTWAREDAAEALLEERSKTPAVPRASTVGRAAAARGTGTRPTDTADHSAAKAEAGRSLRGSFLAKPGASLKPLARDANRSDLDTLRAAHAQVADSGEGARLSHVRAVLGNYSRPEQDRMLQGALMSKQGSGVSLSQISDQKAIDKTEEGARLHAYELLRATHKGRKSADDFDQDDLAVIDAVTPAEVADLFDDALLASAGYA